eukprot:UC4_evm2s1434
MEEESNSHRDGKEKGCDDLALGSAESLDCTALDVTYVNSLEGPITGNLYVTSFRLIFRTAGDDQTVKIETKDNNDVDLPLGLIYRIEKVGGQISSRGENSYGIEVFCKDLRHFKFAYKPEGHARRKAFESLSALAFPLNNNLPQIAYRYVDNVPVLSGGPIQANSMKFDTREEFKRQKLPRTWRISDINVEYKFSETYPNYFAVPENITDKQLTSIGAFRSRARIPILSWINPKNGASITRCSQPRVGISGKRCEEDESLLKSFMTSCGGTKYWIFDARPRLNVITNQALGKGIESVNNYEGAQIILLDIHNIHVMRDSLRKLGDLCLDIDDLNWLANVESTKWLEHIKLIMSGALKISTAISKGESAVIHCSDGWDRTAQLSALSMLLLDPFYRTIDGFEILIDKEWLSFGHKFGQRIGHGSSDHSNDNRSPVFVQFIDCVWQIIQQFPCAFEFNEDFLLTILEHLYSCYFGTFLFDNEFERVKEEVSTKTLSLWDYINTNRSSYRNVFYVQEDYQNQLRPLATLRKLKIWTNYYLKTKGWSSEASRRSYSTVASKVIGIGNTAEEDTKKKTEAMKGTNNLISVQQVSEL